MRAPNMAAITASLERSLQNCSLNHHRNGVAASGGDDDDGFGLSSSSDDVDPQNHHHRRQPLQDSSNTSLELNSHVSLPYHWEQCLDLTTGEIYYINWRNGMKAKEDPRQMGAATDAYDGDFYSSDESSYDSEESSSESSQPSAAAASRNHQVRVERDHVLVVGGCKICLMYFMVPKHVQDCPKCNGQLLLHFDRSSSENASGSP